MGSCYSNGAKFYVVYYSGKPLVVTKYYDIAERAFLEGSMPDITRALPPGRQLICYNADSTNPVAELIMNS